MLCVKSWARLLYTTVRLCCLPSGSLLEDKGEEETLPEAKQPREPWVPGVGGVTAPPDGTHILSDLPSHFPHANPLRKIPLSLLFSWNRFSFLPKVMLDSKWSIFGTCPTFLCLLNDAYIVTTVEILLSNLWFSVRPDQKSPLHTLPQLSSGVVTIHLCSHLLFSSFFCGIDSTDLFFF